MIEKDKFHIFNYIKKEEYCASMDGMRYMLKKHKKKSVNASRSFFYHYSISINGKGGSSCDDLAGAMLLCQNTGRKETADGI
mgnify:CR=1 FL=1